MGGLFLGIHHGGAGCKTHRSGGALAGNERGIVTCGCEWRRALGKKGETASQRALDNESTASACGCGVRSAWLPSMSPKLDGCTLNDEANSGGCKLWMAYVTDPFWSNTSAQQVKSGTQLGTCVSTSSSRFVMVSQSLSRRRISPPRPGNHTPAQSRHVKSRNTTMSGGHSKYSESPPPGLLSREKRLSLRTGRQTATQRLARMANPCPETSKRSRGSHVPGGAFAASLPAWRGASLVTGAFRV